MIKKRLIGLLVALAALFAVLVGTAMPAGAVYHQGMIRVHHLFWSEAPAIKVRFENPQGNNFDYNVPRNTWAGEGTATYGLSEPVAVFVGAGWCISIHSKTREGSIWRSHGATDVQGGSTGVWKSLRLGNPDYDETHFEIGARQGSVC